MKILFLAAAAACLAVLCRAEDVKVVGDEASGIFTKIISDAPGGSSNAEVYSADDNVEPIFYDAQARRQSSRRRQQSYLEQPNRYQNQNLFSQNLIRDQNRRKTQAGIKYDNFGRPIQTFGNQANINRFTGGRGGNILSNQLSQRPVGFSQGNLQGNRPVNAFNQFQGNAIGFGSSSGRPTSFTGQQPNQQFGISRPPSGQQFGISRPPSQQFNNQFANQQGQLNPSSGSQFGQQFGAQGSGQFGQQSQINSLNNIQGSQFNRQPVNQFGQQLSSQFTQSGINQLSQGSRFPQQSVNQFGQPIGANQFRPQSSGSQFTSQSGFLGQQTAGQFQGKPINQFGQQQVSTQFGQQVGSQFGQQFAGQQSGFQSGIRSTGGQFNRIEQQSSGIIPNAIRRNEVNSLQTSHFG